MFADDLIEAFGQPGCPVCRLSSEPGVLFLLGVRIEEGHDTEVRRDLLTLSGGDPLAGGTGRLVQRDRHPRCSTG